MATIVTSIPPHAVPPGLSLTSPIVGPFRGSKSYYGVFTGQANFLAIGDNTYQQVGQSFTTPVVGEIIVNRTLANLYKGGNPTDALKADIYLATAAGIPTGPSLATSTNSIPGPAIVGVYQGIFLFAPLTLPNNTKYVVMLSRTGSLDNSNYFGYITNSNSTDANQTGSYWTGSAWAEIPYDFPLEVHGIGDLYYYIGRSIAAPAQLSVYRSVTPDIGPWVLQSTRNFTTEILNLSATVLGPVIHLMVQDGTAVTSVTTKYASYNTAQNTFGGTEIVFPNANVSGQVAGVGAGASLAVRSTGEVVAFYSGAQAWGRSRLYSRRRSFSAVWSTEEQVDLNDDTDNTLPVAVLGAADRVHFGFQWGASFALRTLPVTNALSSATTASMTGPADAASLSYGGGTRVVFAQASAGSKNAYFDSSDFPTVTVSDQSIAAATAPHRVTANGSDVFRIYRSSADGDLYVIKSTDGGATYGAPVLFFTGTIAAADISLSRNLSHSVHQRGLNKAICYVVNDNGTLYYSEYIVAAPPPANEMRVRHVGVWKKPITHVKHAGTWKMATTFVKHAGTWKQMV